jgi:DNA-binding NtrC family response regulator
VLRHDVCIVLNEREPAKAKIAEILELRFADLNITSSRVGVDKNVGAVVAARAPRFVVLDYLLGDFTTGLDVLTLLNELPPEKRPQVIFLTDEPSIHVVVQALKGGALDYLEIDSPQSLQTATSIIERALAEQHAVKPAVRPRPLSLQELVAGAPTMQHALAQLNHAITRHSAGIVLYGQPGTGRTVLAYGACRVCENPTAWSYVDITTFAHAPTKIPGITVDPRGGIRPRRGHLVILDNVEADDGEIAAALAEGTSRDPHHGGTILACTTDALTAGAFTRATQGEMISLPSLEGRRSDIGALVQRFVREAETLSGKRIAPFDSELTLKMASAQWPGNVRQLRLVTMNIAFDSLTHTIPPHELFMLHYELSNSGDAANGATVTLDPLTIAATFELTGRNYRRTAARLGCDVAAIRQMLGLSASRTTESP